MSHSFDPSKFKDADPTLFEILQLTFSQVGDDFFRSLVKNLCLTVKVDAAWITEYVAEDGKLRSRAFWLRDHWVEEYEYAISGTPCEPVVEKGRLIHFPENVISLFPADPDLPRLGAVSYIGAPLFGSDEVLIGHLAVLDSKPMPEDPLKFSVLRTFAARAASELRRLHAEGEVQAARERLQRVLDTAMDAIIEIDPELNVSQANPAALRLLGGRSEEIIGRGFQTFLNREGSRRLRRSIEEIDSPSNPKASVWVPSGLGMKRADGKTFQTECTISRGMVAERPFYTMIVRDVDERLEAERRIRRLTEQTEYLEEELRKVRGLDQILGKSPSMLRMLGDIRAVAETDSTVLIEGETGTGKELVARSIHAASKRADKPLITLNCAAIPASLVESELFGHEKGAFTGAVQRRDGRFSLADGGTIFLDEVGELPLDVQAKLLRVLQEGEVTPVGGGKTIRVDVRVLAATNRKLPEMVKTGEFREDLFYRLNVFPIRVPPLRDRGDDLVLLAEALAEKTASRLGKPAPKLSLECRRLLKSYRWPGNVRELQNVIERALITSSYGELDLKRALPESPSRRSADTDPITSDTAQILSVSELRELEKSNIIRALEASQWKISGKGGAAEALGMKPTTLNSRMKALGVNRP